MLILLLSQTSEKTTNIVALVSAISILLLVLVLGLIAITNKGYTTKQIVFAAAAVSCSFALSFVKVTPVAYGGSITLASFAPILIYAYYQGFAKALAAGVIFGLLNFLQSPYMLVPQTFLLDYILAFGAIGLMGIMKNSNKSTTFSLILGTSLVYFVRFLMHLFSGIIYFKAGYVLENFPSSNAVIYSALYNLVYLVPDMLISMVALFTLSKTKAFNKISGFLK